MTSPKRKSLAGNDNIHSSTLKKPRTETRENANSSDIPESEENTPPDSLINHAAAIKYWSSIPATVSGVLGGYPQVSRVDLQGSANFLAKLRRRSKQFPAEKGKLRRVVDCGAGIGRIAQGFLQNVADTVDLVEPVRKLTDQVKNEQYVGQIYSLGLEQWYPDGQQTYEVIWNQWCCGQLTDAQLVAYLQRLPAVLCAGGWIVVKENTSVDPSEKDIYDDTDHSVTRSDSKFRALFERAGLALVAAEVQSGMPKHLYPVRIYALQPK